MYLDLINYNQESAIISIELNNGFIDFFINDKLYQFFYLDQKNNLIFKTKLCNLDKEDENYILIYQKNPNQKIIKIGTQNEKK